MKRLLLCSLAILLALPALAADTEWTKWGGPAGNFTTLEKDLLDKWPDTGPRELWRKPVGAGFASPIAVDGKVYVFGTVDDKDTLTCFNADDGAVLWSEASESAYLGTYPGTRATPTVDDQQIYTFGGKGELVCRRLVDGVKLWSLDVMAESSASAPSWGCASAPVFMGDLIYLQGGESGPAVVAIDKTKHTIAWQSEETDPASYSAIVPVTFQGKTQLLAYAGKGVVAIDPATGKTLWKQPLKNPNETTANGVSPLVRDGHMFLAFGYGKGSAMFKVDGQSCDLLWEKDEPANRTVPPLLEGEHLYVHQDDSLLCLHWPDGAEVWKTDLGLSWGGQYVRFGDRMIMLTHKGELLLVEVTPEKCELVSKVKLFEGEENMATPLVYRGRLYVKGPNDLVCFDIKSNAH